MQMPDVKDICDLFESCPSVGLSYHQPICRDRMERALAYSDVVVVAYEEGLSPLWRIHSMMTGKVSRVVGFGRAVSDGALVATLHDIMVHPEYRRQGIGTKVVQLLTRNLDTRLDVIDVGVVVKGDEDGVFEQFLTRAGFGEDDEGSTAMVYVG